MFKQINSHTKTHDSPSAACKQTTCFSSIYNKLFKQTQHIYKHVKATDVQTKPLLFPHNPLNHTCPNNPIKPYKMCTTK